MMPFHKRRLRDNGTMLLEGPRQVGIDFGTTNSSVTYASGDGVRLIQFPTKSGLTASSRSLLYFQQEMLATGRKVAVWTGPRAVEEYLSHDGADEAIQGRLIQSLKSHLSDPTLTGTEIFRKKYLFNELIARILRDLRMRASESLGFDVEHVVAGRPVMFVGAKTEADNVFAETRLKECFALAGFKSVQFALEPVAAAHALGSESGRNKIILIGDFGGGTTDFSLLQTDVTGGAPMKVLASTGVGLAGDALDAKIVRKLVSPALGSNAESRSFGKLLPALPSWIFSNLERWHTLSFLRNHEVRELLRTAEQRTFEPDKIKALRTVIEHDLGYQLHQAVQRLKIELSTREEAHFRFSNEAIDIEAHVTRAEFESWIGPELERMGNALDDLLSQAAIARSEVDKVVLTGGTSLVPAVHRLFTSRFGESIVETDDVFTSVARGLAVIASHPQLPPSET